MSESDVVVRSNLCSLPSVLLVSIHVQPTQLEATCARSATFYYILCGYLL